MDALIHHTGLQVGEQVTEHVPEAIHRIAAIGERHVVQLYGLRHNFRPGGLSGRLGKSGCRNETGPQQNHPFAYEIVHLVTLV